MVRSTPLMRGIPASHPGATLREIVLPALGKPKAEIARLLGVSHRRFTNYVLSNSSALANSTCMYVRMDEHVVA